jgi:hypothetical protein
MTPPADLNGLVCFAERQNLVFAHVPSHFKCSLLLSSSQQWHGSNINQQLGILMLLMVTSQNENALP